MQGPTYTPIGAHQLNFLVAEWPRVATHCFSSLYITLSLSRQQHLYIQQKTVSRQMEVCKL